MNRDMRFPALRHTCSAVMIRIDKRSQMKGENLT